MRNQKKRENPHNVAGVDVMCKLAGIIISIAMVIPAICMIGEWFCNKKTSLICDIVCND